MDEFKIGELVQYQWLNGSQWCSMAGTILAIDTAKRLLKLDLYGGDRWVSMDVCEAY